MTIIFKKPPEHIYQACVKQFGVSFDDGIIFAYNRHIYTKYPMPDYKEVHENTHLLQQTLIGSADVWWEKYLEDKEFRLEQEIQAYKAEMRYVKEYIKNREIVAQIRHQNAIDLSSEIYGKIISYTEAHRILL